MQGHKPTSVPTPSGTSLASVIKNPKVLATVAVLGLFATSYMLSRHSKN